MWNLKWLKSDCGMCIVYRLLSMNQLFLAFENNFSEFQTNFIALLNCQLLIGDKY